jgi:hypothetical protein
MLFPGSSRSPKAFFCLALLVISILCEMSDLALSRFDIGFYLLLLSFASLSDPLLRWFSPAQCFTHRFGKLLAYLRTVACPHEGVPKIIWLKVQY